MNSITHIIWSGYFMSQFQLWLLRGKLVFKICFVLELRCVYVYIPSCFSTMEWPCLYIQWCEFCIQDKAKLNCMNSKYKNTLLYIYIYYSFNMKLRFFFSLNLTVCYFNKTYCLQYFFSIWSHGSKQWYHIFTIANLAPKGM